MTERATGARSGEQPTLETSSHELEAFRQALEDNLYYRLGQDPRTASTHDIYAALAYTVRDQLVGRWRQTLAARAQANPKYVYYLSAEYLPGRQLTKNLLYSGTTDLARQALAAYGLDLEQIVEQDREPGLGNGGLGRLASCMMDSLATGDIACIGYGIRYEFGIFTQTFQDGWQVEQPDHWLLMGNPWEFRQPDELVEVKFGGYTESHIDENGRYRVNWTPSQRVLGEPYHMMVPGFDTQTVNMLRLWRARASEEFDFQLFDTGDYTRAMAQKTDSENISRVLYPNDHTPQGKELRLRQQYFFVACSLQDIVNRFLRHNDDWQTFPEKVAVQLNDTHPVIAIPELMRILLDDHYLLWLDAWDIVKRTFAFTNHTLLPEALEKWPTSLFGRLLPRHLDLIYEINRRFVEDVRQLYPTDEERVARMSIIEEGHDKSVRMAHLAVVGSHSVNGVAPLQSRLLGERLLPDFYEMYPEKFNNKTNGVSARRFVRLANPRLSNLICSEIGRGWLKDLDQLRELEPLADDADFRRRWREVKQANKADLALFIRKQLGLTVEPATMFDVMVKRLHEYKRQLLKALHALVLYNRLLADPEALLTPRTIIFGAKAAPGYRTAKLIIKLINEIAAVINAEPLAQGRLQVAFLPNFNVTLAERIYPAADLSEQIAMAGKEASGTGNMKLALNGALTMGTLDGANIEIRQRVGPENFFLFGKTVEEVQTLKAGNYDPQATLEANAELREAIELIGGGRFSHGDGELFRPIVDGLRFRDEFLVVADFHSYLAAQEKAARAFQDQDAWTRMAILNTARCGYFSSDRTVADYCRDIWQVSPLPVESAKAK